VAGVSVRSLFSLTGIDKSDVRVLLGYALGKTHAQLVADAEYCLSESEAERISNYLIRRTHGEPVSYVTGRRDFYSLTFRVTPSVLIPRPETELLVELALEYLSDHAQLLDMGTGSGVIAICVAHAKEDVAVTATDISPEALRVARKNAMYHQVANRIVFRSGEWFSALAKGIRYDMIVSNPPYIASDDPHLQQGDLRFEPACALTDKKDGLSAFCALVDGAPACLKEGGWLLMEHGYDQADFVCARLRARGFVSVRNWRDLAGIPRVSGGRWGNEDLCCFAGSTIGK
jgi:release factor glutamine methyltransferase